MNNQEIRLMDENEFDELLVDNLPDIPPDDIVTEVTPWKQAMDRIIAGIAMSTITFSFFSLNYILPAIGMIALLLGFRTLKKENVWFHTAFVMTVLRIVCLFPILILNASVFQSKITTSLGAHLLTILNLIFALITFYSLWQAIRTVQQKANVEQKAESAVALMIWYIIICILGIIKIDGMIIVGGLLIVYFFIIRSLSQLSKELDETGYLVEPVETRFCDGIIVKTMIGILLIGVLCGYMFFNSYPMEWDTNASDTETKELYEIKERLTDLGFPENVLKDMSDMDLIAYKEAEQIVVDINEYSFNDDQEAEDLKVTGIAVKLKDEKTWIFLHHFLWQEEPQSLAIKGFHGTESIQIWPVYYNFSDGWRKSGDATGRLLYDKNSETYISDYYYLGEKSYTSNDVFWGMQSSNDLFAAFSLPNDGEKQRGYIMYQAQEIEEGGATSSWFNYTHQEHFLQYPVKTAMETRMENSWNDAGAFMTVQDTLQFWVEDEKIEMVGE